MAKPDYKKAAELYNAANTKLQEELNTVRALNDELRHSNGTLSEELTTKKAQAHNFQEEAVKAWRIIDALLDLLERN